MKTQKKKNKVAVVQGTLTYKVRVTQKIIGISLAKENDYLR
ncbi:hypothetical protein ACJEEJ_13360 [Enterococcus faecalis]